MPEYNEMLPHISNKMYILINGLLESKVTSRKRVKTLKLVDKTVQPQSPCSSGSRPFSRIAWSSHMVCPVVMEL